MKISRLIPMLPVQSVPASIEFWIGQVREGAQ